LRQISARQGTNRARQRQRRQHAYRISHSPISRKAAAACSTEIIAPKRNDPPGRLPWRIN
jgi:hypothetical protein